ncbi:MAG: sulfatase [Bacteroidaceae bacterium]|nr:sulfatase [Bacteroidaceae bacterium]
MNDLFMSTQSVLLSKRSVLSQFIVLSVSQSLFGQTRPNIVYIMTDDHTAQMMSCYGNSPVQTPNLDRIANEGVLFRNSFVANSLSGPSRACMITGKHSHKNGFTNNEHGIFDGSQQTMPKLMQLAGYQTALIGKWHLVSTPTGFNHYDILEGQGEYYNPTFIHDNGTRSVEQGYCTDVITDKAIRWMEQRDKQQPFILFVHHKACHRDWLPDLKDIRAFEDQTFPLPANFWDNYEGRPAAQQQEMAIGSSHDMDLIYDNKIYLPGDTSRLSQLYLDYVNRLDAQGRKTYFQFHDSLSRAFKAHPLTGRELTEFKFQRYMRDYAKVTKSLDENVGRLMKYLEESGLLQNTLVVYTSDQGFYMGEHGWFDKRFMYEESLNTPLVMRLPEGYERRGIIDEMVQNIDYAPTFLEMAGAVIPEDIQGQSLVPLLKDNRTSVRGKSNKGWRDAIYYHYYEYPAEHMVKRHYGVRTSQYKLIHFYRDIDQWELYDLKADPTEMHNLYGDPKYRKVQKQMHRRLRQLQKQYDDPIEKELKNN